MTQPFVLPAEPVTTRRAMLRDIPFLLDLARRESENLGFLPAGTYEGAVSRTAQHARPNDRLWVAEVNADLVGFMYATPGDVGGTLKVVQVCMRPDARRFAYASALVAEAEAHATALQRMGVGLRVATDIDATLFWDALGYQVRDVVRGGARRQRVLERRYKPLPGGLWGAV
jgi:GNAT superfamily N-acetyltransferase